jgi:hypothetical protein
LVSQPSGTDSHPILLLLIFRVVIAPLSSNIGDIRDIGDIQGIYQDIGVAGRPLG